MHAAVDIKFSCAHCGQRMLVEPAAAGHTTNCPGCNSEITVPNHGEGMNGGQAELGHSHEETFPIELAAAVSDLAASRAGWEADDARESIARVEAANAELESELHRTAAELHRSEAELEQLREERESLTSKLATARQRQAAAEAQLGTSNRELSLTRGVVTQLQEALQKAVTERTESADAQASLEWKVTELEASLRNAESECARLNVVSEELLQVRSQMSQLEWERDELRRECEQINRDLNNTENGRELASLRAREKALEDEKQRATRALKEALEDSGRFEQLNNKARTELEEVHRRCVAAEKRAESLSTSEVSRDNEILRGILARQKEELEQRYRELVRFRRARYGLRLTYWIFGLGVLAVTAFAVKVLSDLF